MSVPKVCNLVKILSEKLIRENYVFFIVYDKKYLKFAVVIIGDKLNL